MFIEAKKEGKEAQAIVDFAPYRAKHILYIQGYIL